MFKCQIIRLLHGEKSDCFYMIIIIKICKIQPVFYCHIINFNWYLRLNNLYFIFFSEKILFLLERISKKKIRTCATQVHTYLYGSSTKSWSHSSTNRLASISRSGSSTIFLGVRPHNVLKLYFRAMNLKVEFIVLSKSGLRIEIGQFCVEILLLSHRKTNKIASFQFFSLKISFLIIFNQ